MKENTIVYVTVRVELNSGIKAHDGVNFDADDIISESDYQFIHDQIIGTEIIDVSEQPGG